MQYSVCFARFYHLLLIKLLLQKAEVKNRDVAVVQGVGEYINTKFWCRLCALLHETHRAGHHSVYDRLDDWWRGRGACVDPAAGRPWSTWRDTEGDLLSTACHRQWRQPANTTE